MFQILIRILDYRSKFETDDDVCDIETSSIKNGRCCFKTCNLFVALSTFFIISLRIMMTLSNGHHCMTSQTKFRARGCKIRSVENIVEDG